MYPVSKYQLNPCIPPQPRRVVKKRLVFKPRLGTLVLVAALLYLTITLGRMEIQARELDREITAALQAREKLLQEEMLLRGMINQLHDPVYIERLARETLGLVKPDERVLILAQPGEVLPLAPADPQQDIRD